MGLIDRLRGPNDNAGGSHAHRLLGGDHSLQVVGESFRQEALWKVGGRSGSAGVHVVATLVPEPSNEHDQNAVGVWISEMLVGYLARDDAARFSPILQSWALQGVIVDLRASIAGATGGEGMLGVLLRYDPTDFGFPPLAALSQRPMHSDVSNAPRTGLSSAGIDLAWLDALPANDAQAVKRLRELLKFETEPVTRHYQWVELERRLYKARDAFASALAEFDGACIAHDAEMDSIRPILVDRVGSVPLLETYRQMWIRLSKANNHAGASRCAQRGIDLYGDA
jgi:hypothetical protein